jgi:hypothetical protein
LKKKFVSKEHKNFPGWFSWCKYSNGRTHYMNEKFPHIQLVQQRVPGVLYPYSFMVGHLTKNKKQFVGYPTSMYGGIAAMAHTDYAAKKITERYLNK